MDTQLKNEARENIRPELKSVSVNRYKLLIGRKLECQKTTTELQQKTSESQLQYHTVIFVFFLEH